MLEFYPMPTNLNHASGLYPHHQHHGGARFLDNPATATVAVANVTSTVSTVLTPAASPHTSINNNNNNNNNGQTMTTQHHQGNGNTMMNTIAGSPTVGHVGMLQMHNNGAHLIGSSVNSSAAIDAQSQTSSPSTTSALSTLTLSLSATVGPMGVCGELVNANGGSATPTSSSSTSLPTNRMCNSSSSSSSCSSSASSVSSTVSSTTCPSARSSVACATSTTLSTTAAAAPSSSSSSSSSSSCSSASSTTCTTVYTSAATSSSTLGTTSKLSPECSGRTDVGHIKCEKNYEICEGCGQKIHDRFLMNVGDANWHEQCLACCYCGMQLHNTCYVRNTKLYCKLDYDRLFGIKCSACCHPVLPHDMVMRPIPNYIFHLPCFVCYACRLPLQKGEQFMLRDGQLFCFRHDLEKEMYLAAAAAAQHCGFVGLDDEDLLRPRDGRRGPKRPRTILTSQQRKQFKASFDQSPKPCRKVREALAKDTGLSVRVVQVWFQNQRAKMKKIQRKAKNGGGATGSSNGRGSGGGGSSNNNGDDKDMLSLTGGKDGKDNDKCLSDTVMGGSAGDNSYLSLDSAFGGSHHQPLNPNLPFSPDDYPANSNDSFCSSDLSLDGSNFDQLDDDTDSLSLNNLELQSTSSSGNHNHNHHHHSHNHNHHSNPHDMIANLNNSLINPIDKLYLMQNSYFNTEQ